MRTDLPVACCFLACRCDPRSVLTVDTLVESVDTLVNAMTTMSAMRQPHRCADDSNDSKEEIQRTDDSNDGSEEMLCSDDTYDGSKEMLYAEDKAPSPVAGNIASLLPQRPVPADGGEPGWGLAPEYSRA